MGSNQCTKRLVRAGLLCYICEQATPTIIDEVRGKLCAACHLRIETFRKEHALTGGYRARAVQPASTCEIDLFYNQFLASEQGYHKLENEGE